MIVSDLRSPSSLVAEMIFKVTAMSSLVVKYTFRG